MTGDTSQRSAPAPALTIESLRRAKRLLDAQPALPPGPTPERPFVLQLAGRTYICQSYREWQEGIDDAIKRVTGRAR